MVMVICMEVYLPQSQRRLKAEMLIVKAFWSHTSQVREHRLCRRVEALPNGAGAL